MMTPFWRDFDFFCVWQGIFCVNSLSGFDRVSLLLLLLFLFLISLFSFVKSCP
jgi:hypothetical protein